MGAVEHAKQVLLLLTAVILSGTAGYMLIGGPEWGFLDSLFQTVTTISTVGFQEVHPLNSYERIFTIILILSGVGTLTYGATTLIAMAIEGQFKRAFGRTRMERTLSTIKNHHIICGFGRMGQHVCKELKKAKASFVVVENDESLLRDLEEQGYLFIQGDATDEAVLEKAQIDTASNLISLVSTDADNVFICLTASELNPNLQILTRALDERSESKLKKAGAAKVFLPYRMGGNRIVQAILKPTVHDFIEVATKDIGKQNLRMEEIEIKDGSKLQGVTLRNSNIRRDFGLIIIAIQRKGDLIFNPNPETVILANDKLLTMGKSGDLKKLRNQIVD